MRRKHLILASCIISALLLTFTFHVSADENVTADSGASSNSAPLLDSYFWDNYYLLPYIESDNRQYIDTGVTASSDLSVNLKLSDLQYVSNTYLSPTGCTDGTNNFYIMYTVSTSSVDFKFYNKSAVTQYDILKYNIFDLTLSNNPSINGNVIRTFEDEFTINKNIYIFAVNNNGSPASYSKYKLYSYSIFDNTLNDGSGGYVRYYYPAKSKSGDVIGLYDAINKTFVSTGSSYPFPSPTDDQVLHFQIGNFITAGLGWIGDILEYAITEPIILFFMAVGLCGVAFRWARRVYHF